MRKSTKSVDSITANMLHQNYRIALVLLAQLQQENHKLSEVNQLQYLECLYQTQRYYECLEHCKKFANAGTTRKELIFIRGLCYYQLEQYQSAINIFQRYPEWERWEEKCRFMIDIDKNQDRIVQIGEPQVCPDNVKIEMYQTTKVVTVTFLLKGLLNDQLMITPLPYSLDICINYGKKQFKKSLELYDEIIPKSMELNITPKKLEIKLEKVKPMMWQSLEKTESDILGNSNISIDDLIKELDNVPIYTDEEAANMFKLSQEELSQNIETLMSDSLKNNEN